MEQPNSIETEQLLLGTLFTFTNSMYLAIEEGLVEEHFYDNNNKEIFKVMKALNNNKQRTDLSTVMTRLEDSKKLDVITKGYLYDLMEIGTSTYDIENFVNTLQNKNTERDMLALSNETIYNLSSGMTTDEIRENLGKKALEITTSGKKTESTPIQDILPEWLEELRIKQESDSTITGLETGYMDLDKLTGGLQDGNLIIIGARPSVGKTALALNLAQQIATRNDKTTLIFSIETRKEDLTQRVISTMSGIQGSKLRDGEDLTNNEYEHLNNAYLALNDLPIIINDSSYITTNQIFSECRRIKNDKGLGIVIIDYLTLITSLNDRGSDQEKASQISRELKILARELDVPVIALAQLNRGVEHREDKRPVLSDLRSTGAIEQDADIVAFIHREEYNDTSKVEESDRQETDIIFRKHRNGALGTVTLMFTKSIGRFSETPYE